MKSKMLLGACIAFILLVASLGIVYLYKQKDTLVQNAYEKRLEVIYTKYPAQRTFNPDKLFAGGKLSHIIENNNYYIAFITYGSGVPIVDAKCFKVDSNNLVTEIKYTKDIKKLPEQFNIKECK
jgi:hypothetical protein